MRSDPTSRRTNSPSESRSTRSARRTRNTSHQPWDTPRSWWSSRRPWARTSGVASALPTEFDRCTLRMCSDPRASRTPSASWSRSTRSPRGTRNTSHQLSDTLRSCWSSRRMEVFDKCTLRMRSDPTSHRTSSPSESRSTRSARRTRNTSRRSSRTPRSCWCSRRRRFHFRFRRRLNRLGRCKMGMPSDPRASRTSSSS